MADICSISIESRMRYDACDSVFIQYMARIWPWYSLRGLHIRITWVSLYGIDITCFSLYGNAADI